ncbi:MAG: hypothetical protein HFJ35_07485 [Clostridia bacterium]|nr:hypothetical protein [Clostridia bacterium]
MLKFILGMIFGGIIVFVLYACILIGKENDKLNEQIKKEKISQHKE